MSTATSVSQASSIAGRTPDGDREQLLARLRERIVRFAASRVSRDVAEDLAQDVLLLLTTKYADKTALEDLMPLAFKIVRFKLVAHRRKSVRRGEHTQAQVDDPSFSLADDDPWSGPEVQLARRELRDRLTAALGQLTGRCRALFRLKVEGLSFVQIQEALAAKSINTAYTWDARCRQKLLALLGGAWER